MNTRQLGTVIKDVASTAVGTYILVFQATTGQFNLTLAGIAAALLGIPGIGGVIQLTRGTPATPTQLGPSPSALPPSSPSPSSPSSTP